MPRRIRSHPVSTRTRPTLVTTSICCCGRVRLPRGCALVLISVTPSQTDLNHIIFGNLLGVSWDDLWQVLILGAVTFAILVLKRRDFTLYAFDPTHAHAIGLSPRLLGANAPGPARAHGRRRAAGGGRRARRRHAHHPGRHGIPPDRQVLAHARHRPSRHARLPARAAAGAAREAARRSSPAPPSEGVAPADDGARPARKGGEPARPLPRWTPRGAGRIQCSMRLVLAGVRNCQWPTT